MTIFVKNVKATNLFGMYNISWNFNHSVSIIIGPNGCGKSTALKIIDDTVNGINSKFPADSVSVETASDNIKTFDLCLVPNLAECLKRVEHCADQINMFTTMINEMFEVTKKHIEPKDLGFVVMQKDKELNQAWLSPSEMYFISLFFNLIFKAENCLVLIDNLGDGLHVNWQEVLIDNINDIAEIRGLQVIVVSHSISTIADHTDQIAEMNIKVIE